MSNNLFPTFSWGKKELGLGGIRKAITSSYGKGGSRYSTLHEPTIRALLSRCKCDSALGFTNDGNIVAEFREDENKTSIVLFSPKTRRFMASTVNDGVFTEYRLSKSTEDGAALIFSLLPVLEKKEDGTDDEEFCSNMEILKKSMEESLDQIDCTYILCDNIYRRATLKDGRDFCVVPVNGKMQPFTETAAKSGVYEPVSVVCGKFQILNAKDITIDIISVTDGEYTLDKERVYSETEESMIPQIPSWYIPPKYLVDCLKMVSAKDLARPVRNIMLRGEAGTGKTETAKAIAAGLSLPYVSLCCHPDMQITDFVGTILPKLDTDTHTNDTSFPTYMDLSMNLGDAYEKLTGKEAPDDIDGDTVISLMLKKASERTGGVQYEYCDSPLIRAIKYGYLCEIQEPAIIERAGVLAGLNSLLDTCQTVTLPTGEVIKRHPDCVLVITTNTNYQGCKEMNNSVISRMSFKKDTTLPSQSELKKRVSAITGFSDENVLDEMITVINEIHKFCSERMITDGSCGVRELIDWIQSYQILDDIITAAECTIIPSATADTEYQSEIANACLLTHFG